MRPATSTLDISLQPTSSYKNEEPIGISNPPTAMSESSGWERALIEGEVPETALSLHPSDSGFHAYAYLCSAWVLEFLVWSFPFSYGVFLNYYNTVLFAPNDPQRNLLPLVGTLSSGIIYIASLLVLAVMLKYPTQNRNIGYVGLVFCVTGLVGAGFSTRPVHLVVTQGIIYSVGGTMLYFPAFTYLMEWFSIKRGLATGILFTGTGLGGVIMPFVTEILLRRYGHQKTFFILAALFGGLASPTFVYIKPRLPVAQVSAMAAVDTSFVRNQVFWVLLVANTIQAFGNFLPGIYLPSFASDLKLSTTSGTLALALMNATGVPGQVIIGEMSDRFDLRVAISFSTVGSALAILFVWGFASELAVLLFFACLYGFFSSGFSVLWSRFTGLVATEDPRLHNLILCLFIAARGLGNVLSGPLSTVLFRHSPLHDTVHYGYGVKGYGSLILFSGLAMLASTAAITYPAFVGKKADTEIALENWTWREGGELEVERAAS